MNRFDHYLEESFAGGREAMTVEQLVDKLAELTAKDERIGRPVRMRADALYRHIQQYQRRMGEENSIDEVYWWKPQ